MDYDLFVIGAGSGGVRAARLAAESGARVGIAEQYRPGGTCVVRGCVPKKYMVYASEFPHIFREAAGFGWELGDISYDHGVFLSRLHKEVDRLSELYARNLERAGAELFLERAEIGGMGEVRLVSSGCKLKARRILLAPGGVPKRPASIEGVEFADVSDEMFLMKELPGSALILGGGYIAVEFAGILNGLGVETILAYRGDLVLRGFDMDLRRRVQDGLVSSGVRVWTGAVPERIERVGIGCRTYFSDGRIHGSDRVLLALGREAATEGLGLVEAGVELALDGSVLVDEYSRSSAADIWAIGDVTNRVNLTPVAIREGEAFARTEFYGEPQFFSHEWIASAVFSQPPLASVGLSEEAARERGEVIVYSSDFRPMRDALAETGERMFMKLVVEVGTDKVLGCHLVGPEAPEMIQLAAIALKMGASKADFDRTCAVHPTLAEELVTLRKG